MRIVSILNQKGGVGKTTTVVHLGAALAQAGQRVLLVDLDPQSHLSLHLGLEVDSADTSVYAVLLGGLPIENAILRHDQERLSLVPSHIDLAAAEVELVSVVGREVILRDALATLHDGFDVCLIDCPPSLGLLTLNALGASEEVLIPLQPHFLALQGFGKLLETTALVNRRVNPKLHVGGVVFCMFETGTRLSAEVTQEVRSFLKEARGTDVPWSKARVFETMIRRNVRLAESPSYGQTVFGYAPNSKGAADYHAFAAEVLAAWNMAPAAVAENDAPKKDGPSVVRSASVIPGEKPATDLPGAVVSTGTL